MELIRSVTEAIREECADQEMLANRIIQRISPTLVEAQEKIRIGAVVLSTLDHLGETYGAPSRLSVGGHSKPAAAKD